MKKTIVYTALFSAALLTGCLEPRTTANSFRLGIPDEPRTTFPNSLIILNADDNHDGPNLSQCKFAWSDSTDGKEQIYCVTNTAVEQSPLEALSKKIDTIHSIQLQYATDRANELKANECHNDCQHWFDSVEYRDHDKKLDEKSKCHDKCNKISTSPMFGAC